MAELVLVRHGRADGNSLHRFLGWADVTLEAAGRHEAAAAAARLAASGMDVIVTSDLVRTRQVADIIATALGIPVEADPRIREINNGDWTLRLPAEIRDGWPDLWEQYTAGRDVQRPGGERWADVAVRVAAALGDLVERPEKVVVVTHAGPVIVAAAWALGITLPGNIFQGRLALPANGSLTTIAPGPTLVGYNDIGHLDGIAGVEVPFAPVEGV